MNKDESSKAKIPMDPVAIEHTHRISLNVVLSFLIIIALTATAHVRNRVYHDFTTLWGDITKTSPNKRRAHENYGQALSLAGRFDEALREFNTVLALQDDGSVPMRDLYREIGVVYYRMDRLEDAIAAWRTGLRHAPYDARLLYNLSMVLLQTERNDESFAYAQAALSEDPSMPLALNIMGQVLVLKQDYEGAIKYYLKAIEQQPDIADLYWNVAQALEQARKYDAAMQYAKKFMEMEQDSVSRQRAAEFIEDLNKKKAR